MEIRYPYYYRKFRCIAGDCPDTCCAGWEIPVDAASEKRYRTALKSGVIKNKTFARKLKRYIKDGRILSDDVTCPFLNQDRLCEMYLELGPEALCNTCARHPRHMEDYGNLHEMVLLLSCPEVARLVLEENDGGFYTRNLPERQGNMEGIDEELLELLLQIRELARKITKDKTLTMKRRMAFVLALGHDVQRRFAQGNRSEIPSLLQKYASKGAAERFFAQWERNEECVRLTADLFDTFAGIETVYQGWPKLVEEGRKSLEDHAHINQIGEKWACVFEYYMYSFLLSALYDGDVLTKIKMAVSCTVMTAELAKSTKLSDVEVCYAVARQIENSGENRQMLEQVMQKEAFKSRKFIDGMTD